MLTECLAAELAEDALPIGASVFYPSGGLLRTGLWTADRTRPPELARERPRETEAMTPERLEEMASRAGRTLTWQPLDELADLVVAGVREDRYVIMKGLDSAAATLRTRWRPSGRRGCRNRRATSAIRGSASGRLSPEPGRSRGVPPRRRQGGTPPAGASRRGAPRAGIRRRH